MKNNLWSDLFWMIAMAASVVWMAYVSWGPRAAWFTFACCTFASSLMTFLFRLYGRSTK